MLPGEWSEKFEFRNRPKDYQPHKRKGHIDDRREQLRRGSEDRPCTLPPARRSIDVSSGSLSGIIRQLNASEIYVFCSSGMPTTRGARASCLEPGDRKKVHCREEESLKRLRIGPGVEWRRKASVDRNVYDAYAS